MAYGEGKYNINLISIIGKKYKEFESYLAIAKKGLPPSAGFGIGIERLTRFVRGL